MSGSTLPSNVLCFPRPHLRPCRAKQGSTTAQVYDFYKPMQPNELQLIAKLVPRLIARGKSQPEATEIAWEVLGRLDEYFARVRFTAAAVTSSAV